MRVKTVRWADVEPSSTVLIAEPTGDATHAIVAKVLSPRGGGGLVVLWLRDRAVVQSFMDDECAVVVETDLVEAIANLVSAFGEGTSVIPSGPAPFYRSTRTRRTRRRRDC